MKKFLENPLISVLLLLVVLAVGFLVLAFAGSSTMGRVEWQKEAYVVRSGDSLWAISSEYCPGNVDRREWIEEVKDLNGMTNSNIYAGQTLTVLVPEED